MTTQDINKMAEERYPEDNRLYGSSKLCEAWVSGYTAVKCATKPLINECRRIKIQRNGYEQKLIIANREINFLESEIKHLRSIIKLNGIKP